MNKETETFGSVVRERMQQRGVSPRELASVIHRSESQVSLLLRDRVATPTPDVVGEIARFLGLDEVRLVRLIGYLTSVPEAGIGDQQQLPFPPADPRATIVKELVALNDEQVNHLLATIRFMQGATTDGRRRAAGRGIDL